MSAPAFKRRASGSATIEFAMVMLLGLLPLMFTIMDYSFYFFQATLVQSSLWNAAREGASYDASVVGDCPTAKAEEKLNDLLSGLNLADLSIDSSIAQDNYGSGPVVAIWQMTVQVSATYTPIVGWMPMPESMGGAVTVPLEVQLDPGC